MTSRQPICYSTYKLSVVLTPAINRADMAIKPQETNLVLPRKHQACLLHTKTIHFNVSNMNKLSKPIQLDYISICPENKSNLTFKEINIKVVECLIKMNESVVSNFSRNIFTYSDTYWLNRVLIIVEQSLISRTVNLFADCKISLVFASIKVNIID